MNCTTPPRRRDFVWLCLFRLSGAVCLLNVAVLDMFDIFIGYLLLSFSELAFLVLPSYLTITVICDLLLIVSTNL
jgi:hypothetical protein